MATDNDIYFQAQRTMFMSLIRPIRDADSDQGRDLLRRILGRQEYLGDQTRTRIKSLADTDNFSKLRDDLVQYLKSHVGFTSELQAITGRLSTPTLRKLCAGAVSMWRKRGTPSSISDMIRLLTGRSVNYYDWFHYRTMYNEALLGEEQGDGTDFWLIGGAISTWDEFTSQLRMMDPGGTDAQLILDIVNLCRPVSERVEVSLLDFWDTFDDGGRARWVNIASPAAVVTANKTLSFQASTHEKPNITIKPFDNDGNSGAFTDYNEYVVGFKFKLGGYGNSLTLFGLRNDPAMAQMSVIANSDALHANGSVVQQDFTGTGGGTTGSGFGAGVFNIVPGVWYTLRVYFRTSVAYNEMQMTAWLDGALAFDSGVVNMGVAAGDFAPESGWWSILAGIGSFEIDNIECWRMPMRFATVAPSGYSYTSNFLTG